MGVRVASRILPRCGHMCVLHMPKTRDSTEITATKQNQKKQTTPHCGVHSIPSQQTPQQIGILPQQKLMKNQNQHTNHEVQAPPLSSASLQEQCAHEESSEVVSIFFFMLPEGKLFSLFIHFLKKYPLIGRKTAWHSSYVVRRQKRADKTNHDTLTPRETSG